MDHSEQTEREVIKRTIALLLSFAVMAQGVAARSYLVRCVMLWILRRSEASGRRFVYGPQATPSAPWVLHRNSPAEALRLAQTFRDLARVLEDELRLEERFARWWAGDGIEAAPECGPSHPGSDCPRSRLRLMIREVESFALEPAMDRVLLPP